jgi:hypothetical protein
LSAGSIAAPRARVRRRRPWGPRTRWYALTCVIDVVWLIACLLWYALDASMFAHFIDFACAIFFGLMLRHHWPLFRASRDRDERGD